MFLEEFYKITKKNLAPYLLEVSNFFSGSQYQSLVDYYGGRTQTISSEPFNTLQSLSDQTKEIFTLFTNFATAMSGSWFYVLLETIEEIDSRIKTTQNINKWSRSSITLVGYAPVGEVNYNLGQNESLERLSQDLLNSDDPEDDWVSIAKRNDLTEEDYTSQGGNNLYLPAATQSNFVFPLVSVVAVVNGKSVYGLDLYKKFMIDTTIGDLVTLDNDTTLTQSCDILIKLKKNDNPDFRNQGLQTNLIIGGNKATLNFPVIIRQLSDTFSTDDTFKNFSVTSLQSIDGSLQISYQVESRLSEVLNLQTSL